MQGSLKAAADYTHHAVVAVSSPSSSFTTNNGESKQEKKVFSFLKFVLFLPQNAPELDHDI